MSSAGVYLKSDEMPHRECDPTDLKSRHKGKLDSEIILQQLKLPWCSIRPTYICGPGNYNPLERYFFERIDAGRPICIPGHGQHLTGLGHVYDLAIAMANCIGREHITNGNVYNVQNTQAITFDGVVKVASKVMNLPEPTLIHFNPKDYVFPKDAKAFPMRPQHFFTSITKTCIDLDWKPIYDNVESILKDSYDNDFIHVKASGNLKNEFLCDDMICKQFFLF